MRMQASYCISSFISIEVISEFVPSFTNFITSSLYISLIENFDLISSYIPGDEFKFNYDYKNVGSYDIPGYI